jgi:hypothetical protein
VIHDHDALELASAAIDFGLTPAEADRLSEAVADCPVCAERAAAYRREMRLLADLPAIEPSSAVRRRVMHAAVTGRTVDTRTPMLLLAAALLLGALLAVAAVVGGVFNNQPHLAELPPIDSTTPGPSSLVAAATPAATSSSSSEPGASGLALQPDTIAEVVSNNVRIRSQPRVADDSIKYEPLLKTGDRLFVIAGPVAVQDYEWYQVAAWRPSAASPAWPVGWVVRADHDGTPWVRTATGIGCPAAPSVDVVIDMHPYEALACYGDQRLALRAYVAGGLPTDGCAAGGAGPPCVTGPAWLAGTGGRTASVDATPVVASGAPAALRLAFDPDGAAAAADLPAGRMVVIEGAFDHPRASACAAGGGRSTGSLLTDEEAVLRCRTRFVLSRATPEKNFLVPQTAAVTTTAGLRVRSLPVVDDSSQRYEPLLASGTRLFVLRGPVLGSGYDWYEVIAPTVTQQGGGPMIGWIAVAARNGETWAVQAGLSCPRADRPVTLADVGRLSSGAVADGGLSCFGARTITTTAAFVQVGCAGADPRSTDVVSWLASPARMTLLLTDGSATVTARVHPELAGRTACDIAPEARWMVDGHFDDRASASCGGGDDPAAVIARYRCRSTFIVTDLRPAGG